MAAATIAPAAVVTGIGGTGAAGTAPPADKARQTAESFEALFLSTVIDRMFASLPVDGPFGGGQAEATYRSFLADAYADALTQRGGVGIADALYDELIRLQEASSP